MHPQFWILIEQKKEIQLQPVEELRDGKIINTYNIQLHRALINKVELFALPMGLKTAS